jgi:hypothetical protein
VDLIAIKKGHIGDEGKGSYEVLQMGVSQIYFKTDNDPINFPEIFLAVEDSTFRKVTANDSVVCFFLPHGRFAISFKEDSVPLIFSRIWDGSALSIQSWGAPTALLFERRGPSLFMMAASPYKGVKEMPEDILTRLVGTKE